MKRCVALLALTAVVSACGAKEEAAPDTTAATPAAAAPAPATLDQYAGDFTWVMKAEAGDSVMGTGTSHQNADGTGWTVNAANPKDTTKYTATIVGDSVVDQSAPYTDPNMPKNAGQMTWRFAAPTASGASSFSGNITVSPAAKPDSVVVRARVEVTKK